MWGISRRTLDAALFQLARQAGATVWQPARCQAIEPGPFPAVRIRDLSTNALHRIESRRIILADGKAALLPSRPAPTRDLGIKTTFAFDSHDAHSDAIELFGLRGCYGGLAPIEHGLFNAAFSLPASRLAHRHGDLDAVMRDLIAENPALARRLAHARPLRPWIASGLPRFALASRWPMNVIPIGNAAAAIEPIGGEGMGLALRSAVLAADFLHRHLDSPTDTLADSAALRTQFHRLWQRRRLACRALGVMLSFPPAARLMVAVASAGRALPAAMLHLLGKSDQIRASILPSA
jgi:flavin-dependent dehydrogenase